MTGTNLHLLRFLAVYTILMTAIYSLIPYKTPWNMLGFLHGMILLAGAGAVAITKMLPNAFARTLIILLMLIGGVHLAWQAYLANYQYYENPANPYVYAHPANDVFTIVRRVEEMSQAHPGGHAMYVQVISPDDDYWPLPWYLRAFNNIGWWKQVDESVPSAPLIIASPQVETALMRKLYELPPPGQRPLYVPLFDAYTELRPQVELRGYVRKDLWDRFQEQQTQYESSYTKYQHRD
jgi:predicted membrane-bound mannosyltransferase